MVIQIKLHGPWRSNPEKLKLPVDDDGIVYCSIDKNMTGQEILDAVGISPKEVCFIRVNTATNYVSKDFKGLDFTDGDIIELYPFVIGG